MIFLLMIFILIPILEICIDILCVSIAFYLIATGLQKLKELFKRKEKKDDYSKSR